MKKLVLLDAYALIYRAFYALMRSPRINSKGFNTSTVFGFVNTLKEIIDKEKPTHIGIAFDPKGLTFRHEAYPAYKAQRDKTPENIQESVPIIKEIIKAFNITIFEEPGYEADDVIGTLAKIAEKNGFETYMVTPDKDYCQLVTEHIHIIHPSNGKKDAEILGIKEVTEKYGLENTEQVIDMLGLMGDTADNVPGCPGVGPKTAVALINQYKSIEGIYENIDQIKGKVKENLETNKEKVLFSKFLVTIKTDVPVSFNEEEIAFKKFNEEKLRSLFEELEFRTLLKKFFNIDTKKAQEGPVQLDLFGNFVDSPTEISKEPILRAPKNINTDYQILDDEGRIDEFIAKILGEEKVSFTLATTSNKAIDAKIIGCSFSIEEGRAFFIPINGREEEKQNRRKKLVAIFENEKIEKIGFDIKYSIIVLKNENIQLRGKLFDVMLAHYVIQPEQKHYLPYMADTYLHEDSINIDNFFNGKEKITRNLTNIPLDTCSKYISQRTDFCFRLESIFIQKMQEDNEYTLFEKIEIPLMPVLAQMEYNGVCVDKNVLGEISILFAKRLSDYEEKVYEICGQKFNISSPRQVGEMLFDVLKLDEKAKKTKSGQYETSEAVLESLKFKSPVIEPILNYRAMKKLLSTYVDALPELVNTHTNHIHTSFNQAVTATGRLSSSDPNLQNIPVRGEDGKEIRKAFVPEEGCEFFSADYSQIELRILAHLSNDQHMIEAFQEGHDIHLATAAKIFHKDIEEVTADERRKAKTANFGIVYGITSFGLSQRIGISRGEAKELIDNYFETFSNIKTYTEQCVEIAKQQGYVETIYNRRRYLPDINSQNAVVRKFAERNAVNAPIQGSAADIIKVAMIHIAQRFEEEHLRSKMILQVHDELNFSVYPDEKEKVQNIVQYEMEHACQLHVPLIADCGWGKNWLEAH